MKVGMTLERHGVDQSLKLYIVLNRAYRAITERVNKKIQTYKLNPTEFAVLELLYHKGEQPLQQIGGKILLASGSITYVVDKLEKKGYLERVASISDRRVIYAHITSNGKKLMDDIFPSHADFIDECFSTINMEEKEQLIEMMKKIGFAQIDIKE